MGFSRQIYWSGLPFPAPGDLPHPGIEPISLVPPSVAGRFFTCWAIREALMTSYYQADFGSFKTLAYKWHRCPLRLVCPSSLLSSLSSIYVYVLSRFTHVWLFVTLWAIAHQASLSMGFSTQECWSGLPGPPPGDLPDLGIKPVSLTSPALTDGFFVTILFVTPVLNHVKLHTKLSQDLTHILINTTPLRLAL